MSSGLKDGKLLFLLPLFGDGSGKKRLFIVFMYKFIYTESMIICSEGGALL